MIRWLILAMTLGGCQERARSPEYFASHPDEAAEVAKACGRGTKSGDECANARAAMSTIEREARMKLYLRSFK